MKRKRSEKLQTGVKYIIPKIMLDPLDWNDSASVLIQPVEAVAVYINPNNDVVLRQQNALLDDDSVVIIPKQHINLLISRLMAIKEAV